MENCFVLFYFFIKPTVTGEMAVSSTGLGLVTREKVRSVMGHTKNLSKSHSQTGALSVDTVMLSHLYATGVQAPVLHLRDLEAAHFRGLQK